MENQIKISENTNKQRPATYKQVQYFEQLGGNVECATSQLTRKLDRDVMSEAIDAQKDGEQITITL